MGLDKCGECGDDFAWDPDAASAVCLNCGLLQDSSQLVLDSHVENEDNGKHHDVLAHTLYPRSTLKSLRSKGGWDLAGQGKAAALERNKNVMAQYTAALAKRIGHPGLFPRTQFLFDQALERGHVRWGRKARLVAGAALAIALREARKGETIRDIAFLLEESPVAVARSFTRLVELLQIKLASVDTSWHFPSLRNRLLEILNGEQTKPSLPHNLLKLLKSLQLSSVLRTATSLSDLVSRAGTVANLPSPPSACAIFILAIEGELLSSLPNCEQLAKALAPRFGVSGELIMRRYKVLSDEVQTWSQNVPWLRNDAQESSSKKSKVARRVAVARSLKDVVQFQEGVWKAAFEAPGPLGASDIEMEGSVSTESEAELNDDGVDPHRDTQAPAASSTRPKKRRRLRPTEDLSEFLLDPLHAQPLSRSSGAAGPSLDAVAHILAADSPSFEQPATRLQVLTLSKSADDITDEELFEEGEYESLMRSQEERDVLARAFNWTLEEGGLGEPEEGKDIDTDKEDRIPAAQNTIMPDRPRGVSSRINIEALNRLLHDTEVLSEVEACYEDDDDWPSSFAGVAPTSVSEVTQNLGYNDHPLASTSALRFSKENDVLDDDVEVEPWKPLSPGRGTDWEDNNIFQ